jgi:hypothetical protein
MEGDDAALPPHLAVVVDQGLPIFVGAEFADQAAEAAVTDLLVGVGEADEEPAVGGRLLLAGDAPKGDDVGKAVPDLGRVDIKREFAFGSL